MKFFSKTIIFIIIFLLIFNSSGSLNNKSGFLNLTPQKVEAVWWSTVFGQIVDYAKDVWNWIEKNWQKMMRDLVAKRIIDYIVDQTVQWIQGGGEPKFVTNWDGFVKDAGKIAFDAVIHEIALAGLCSPFGLQVRLALLPVKKFSTQIRCTLDDVVKNINNFYVDFSVGGWDGYLLSLEPQNNFYGAMLLANDKLVTEIKKSQDTAQKEASAGKGFLGVKKCKAGTIKKDLQETGYTYKKGDKLNKDDKKGMTQAEANEMNKPMSKKGGEATYDTKGMIKDDAGNYCKSSDLENSTPGALVGDAVGSAITTDSVWAANISSWVSALVNAAINRLVEKGLSEMTKSDPDAQPDYYPEEYASIRAAYYEQDKERMISEVRRAAGNGIGVDVSATTQETLAYASSTLAMLQEMQSLGCSVSANEIIIAQSEVDNLSAQVGDAEGGQSEADLLINDIRTTDPSDTAAWSSILDRYDQFMNRDKQNLDELQAITVQNINIDPQGDAQDKLTAAINANTAVSARLTACKSPIVINDGLDTATSTDVSLKLNATSSISGISNVTQIMVSNDSTFLNAVWENYTTIKSWSLTVGAGLKIVYVKFRNASGNESNPFSDDITLQ